MVSATCSTPCFSKHRKRTFRPAPSAACRKTLVLPVPHGSTTMPDVVPAAAIAARASAWKSDDWRSLLFALSSTPNEHMCACVRRVRFFFSNN